MSELKQGHYIGCRRGGDDVSFTSWVCTQVWSKVAYFRQGLGLLAATGEEVMIVFKNVELGFLMLFFVGNSLRRMGCGGGMEEWGLPDHARTSWRLQLNSHVSEKLPVVVNIGCQLNWIWNQLKDKLLRGGTTVRGFSIGYLR